MGHPLRTRPGLLLATIVLLANLQLAAQSPTRPATVSDTCAVLATIALGDALDQVRAARVFADDSQRRQALAELEILLVHEIESEPDSSIRKAAWFVGDVEGRVRRAQERRERMEHDAQELTATTRVKVLQQLFTQEYRFHLRGVLLVVDDPRSPWRCARRRWEVLRAQALRAEAL